MDLITKNFTLSRHQHYTYTHTTQTFITHTPAQERTKWMKERNIWHHFTLVHHLNFDYKLTNIESNWYQSIFSCFPYSISWTKTYQNEILRCLSCICCHRRRFSITTITRSFCCRCIQWKQQHWCERLSSQVNWIFPFYYNWIVWLQCLFSSFKEKKNEKKLIFISELLHFKPMQCHWSHLYAEIQKKFYCSFEVVLKIFFSILFALFLFYKSNSLIIRSIF